MQEWVFLPVYMVMILPAYRIEPAMGAGMHGNDPFYCNSRRKQGIEVIQVSFRYGLIQVEMKKILQRIYAGIGPRRPGKTYILLKQNGHCLPDLRLYGNRIFLYLEAGIACAFISYFYKISLHYSEPVKPDDRMKDEWDVTCNPGLQIIFLTIAAPFTMLISFCRDAHLAVWLNPQSGATDSFSAGTYCRHLLILPATSSGVSI